MDFFKTIFPLSFKKSKEVSDLVKRIVIYVVALIVGVLLLTLLGKVPVLNILCPILGALCEVYAVGGIVFAILVHCDVIKVGAAEEKSETTEEKAEEKKDEE